MMGELGVSPRGWEDADSESDDESSSEPGAYHYAHDDDSDEDEDDNEEGEPLMDEGGKDESDAGDDMEQESGVTDEVLAEVMQAEEFERKGDGETEIPSKMPVEAAASN